MVLTTSDIGIEAKEVEHNLTTHFKTAKSWDAVVLIDEADVFLAYRDVQDLKRSSLVASKYTFGFFVHTPLPVPWRIGLPTKSSLSFDTTFF
jgi:hypothetical protein